jgi:CxxC-x17-CxxC domain-containing protein
MVDGKPKGPLPGVRVTKRSATPDPRREKACADCGKSFLVEPGQKFYLCPNCYQKAFKPKRKKAQDTQVLAQITCAACGKKEFLPFLPEAPEKALCQSCFRAQKAQEPDLP